MSLRIFHIIFIVVSVLLCLFVAIWGIRQFVIARDGTSLAVGLLFLGCGVVLVLYGQRVYKKLKEL